MPMPRKPEKFHDWNKAFVQMVMSKGMMTGQEMFKGVKSICNNFCDYRDFPKMDTKNKEEIADMIQNMFEAANRALEPLQLHISKIQEEEKSGQAYTQYYVFAPNFENEQLAKLQKHFGEPELEWLKLVATYLVESEDKLGAQTNLINLCMKGGNNSTKKKLNVTDADKALEVFTEAGYLMTVRKDKRRFMYGLGPRFLVEMERWMKNTFEDEIWECGICGKIGMIGVECPRRDCDYMFHKYCVDTGRKDPKCNKCKTAIKIGGVATKRS